MSKKNFHLITFLFLLSGCSGLKVVDPNTPDTKGTLQVDYSGGSPKLVGTYTCTMVAANGKRIQASGKSEYAAKEELLARCQDQTVVSFCKSAKTSCARN